MEMTTMQIDRAVVEQALEALEKYRKMMFVEAGCRFGEGDAAITNLRAALAQQDELQPMPPEQRQRWEELAAMPQQAEPLNLRDPAVQKRLATQWGYVPAAQAEPVEPVAWVGDPSTQDYASTQPEPDAYGYASRLAVAIWEKHYKDIAPQWKPLDDLMGVLTQIDNMTSGLTLLAQQAEPVEPVAWAFRHSDGTYRDPSVTEHSAGMAPLYTAPPQRLPLTEEAISRFCDEYQSPRQLIRAIERAHGIKG